MNRLLVGSLLAAASTAASAGPLLGTPFGITVGQVFGSALPIAGGGLLVVAASSLVIGIRIARNKRKP